MAEDFQSMKEALRLTEEENNESLVPLGLWHSDTESNGFYLVGRLLGRRSFNFEALKNTLMNSFNPIKGLDIRLIEEGRILLNFAHTLDRKRVIDGGPWAFEKNLLVLSVVDGDDSPSRMELNWVDFFVHVHELPLNRMTREMAEFIGNQIGQFKDVDLDNGGRPWGASLRIRVGINVTKPLRRILRLRTTLGIEATISFSYERLPNFCYWCGHLGHIMKYCECQYDPGFDDKQDPLPFGPWLRATMPASLRSRGSLPAITRPSFTNTTSSASSLSTSPHRGAAVFHYTTTQNLTTPLPIRPITQTSPSYAYNKSTSYSTPTISVTPPAISPTPHLCSDILSTLPTATEPALNPSIRGRKKQGPWKLISVPRKRKLIDETLDATECPIKNVKCSDDEIMDQAEPCTVLAVAAEQPRRSL
ncbi:UNVERIFIED_CONTAM: hypothetical protein Slati_0016700 [Sesamum latifolium]|uniref:CCHC-type domain-containing protein n=1 Tax=Sesamum latifolium TaxID=2727402 RepID=A0AAW2Y640_9LAMI